MLKRCEDTKLALNWEKSHFMVKEGIVLGHKISRKGIEVDKAKVDVISKLPHPTTVKGIRSFLGHAGFYRRFIKDFSKISRPMTHLLEKNTPFIFLEDCILAFQTLKKKLTEAPILIAPNWDQPFEIMCDASDYAIGAVLGQRIEKHFRPIHYASKTMTEAETNYTTTEKEMLAVVYAFEKFRSYLIMNKSVVYTDHSALKYVTFRIFRKRVEDLQLGIESYQTKLNLEQPNWDASDFPFKEDYTIVFKPRAVIYRDGDDNRKMMRIDEVHKFSDGTLTRIKERLYFMIKDFKLFKFNKGMENRKWTKDDKRRSEDFIKDTLPILLSFTHCGNKTILRVLRIILVILPEHPSETKVFHNEDGNPARANIKQALGRSLQFITAQNTVIHIWKKLSLPELTPTQMILELADRSTTSPSGIAEDVFVKVGKFHFLADFVVVDYVVDPRVPLILGRPFLRTARALIDVYGEELTLRVDDEAITFKVSQTSRYSYNDAESVNQIDVINVACEEYAQEVLGYLDSSTSGNPTPSLDPILSTSSPFLTPFKEDLHLLKVINDDPSSPLPSKELHVEELKIVKSFIDDPPELELKDLPSHLDYAFLDGTDKLPVIIAKNLKEDEKVQLLRVLKSHKRAIAWKIYDIKGIDPQFCTHKILMEDDSKPEIQHQRRVNPKINEVIKKEVIKCLDVGLIYPIFDSPYFQIPIDPKDQEKTTFTCPYGTFAYRRMPFGLCNAPGTFQRCMMAIFHDMIEETMESLME
ncbi:reverse transcriptase domain-containing protein [Tanacetum coccineum]